MCNGRLLFAKNFVVIILERIHQDLTTVSIVILIKESQMIIIRTEEKKLFKKKPITVQICRLENIEHKSMKQVSYSDKYSLSVCRAHLSHIQLSFVVRVVFYPRVLHM